jgi:hypothetical protein
MERDVPDDHVRVLGEPETQNIRADDGHVRGSALIQASCALGVDLDRGHRSAVPAQRQRHGAVTGPDLQDRTGSPRDEFFDIGDH